MKPNRVIVAGSRTFVDYALLDRKLTHILQRLTPDDTAIVSGLARGADLMGKRWAEEHGFDVLPFPANWYPRGKSGGLDRGAGYRRNEEMLKVATHLVAFWDGQSHGTSNMIRIAREADIKVAVVRY
jgi:hypothetical protein